LLSIHGENAWVDCVATEVLVSCCNLMPVRVAQGSTTFFNKKPFCFIFQHIGSVRSWKTLTVFSFLCDFIGAYRVPTRYWKSIELSNPFWKPWKSIEFDQNVHRVLKKYGNSKFNHLFMQILFVTADDRFAKFFFAFCSMNKILDKWR